MSEEPDECELSDRDCPVCPYCGHEKEEWWDGWDSNSDEQFVYCGDCGKDYVATIIQKFDSRKPRGDQDGEDEDQDVEDEES